MQNDEEIWKDVKEFEGIYQISNLGKVKSLPREVIFRKGWSPCLTKEKILKPAPNSKGYLGVTFYFDKKKKTIAIHRLVAAAFLNHIPCGYKLVINHINHNSLDNRVDNLEIVTQRENANKKHLMSSSKYTGVSLEKIINKWKAAIIVNAKRVHLGFFDTEKEASEYYENALKCVLDNRPQDIVVKRRKTISGFTGVYFIRNKWQANVKIGKDWVAIGYFLDKEEAYKATLLKIEELKNYK